jgi:hypothetical protein
MIAMTQELQSIALEDLKIFSKKYDLSAENFLRRLIEAVENFNIINYARSKYLTPAKNLEIITDHGEILLSGSGDAVLHLEELEASLNEERSSGPAFKLEKTFNGDILVRPISRKK